MADIKPIEIDLEPGSEGILRLTAIAITKLALKVTAQRLADRRLSLKLEGEAQGLPDGTLCTVTAIVERNGKSNEVAAGTAPLHVKGSSGSLDLSLDVLETGLFGKGSLAVRITPDFPFADPFTLSPPIAFDHPLTMTWTGAETAPARIGQTITLTPSVHASIFKGCWLRLTIQEYDVGEGEAQDTTDLSMTLTWQGDFTRSKALRIGCTSAEGSPILNYLEASEKGDYEIGYKLEVSSDEGDTFRFVEEVEARLIVLRPTLTSFALAYNADLIRGLTSGTTWEAFKRYVASRPEREYRRILAKGTIEGFARGLAIQVQVSLWGYKIYDPSSAYSPIVTEPLTPEGTAQIDGDGHFEILLLDMAAILDQAMLNRYAGYDGYFAVLRVPKTLTGSRDFAPVVQVMDYADAQLTPFQDEDFALDAGEPPRAKDSKKFKTKKDLGTGVCSSDIQGIHLTRLPGFGSIVFGARGDSLRITCRVRGERRYWTAAAPKFTVEDTAAKKSFDLPAKPADDDPRTLEALVPMTDARIKGKEIRVTATVTKADARMDGTTPVPKPPDATGTFLCKPRLGAVHVDTVNEAGEQHRRISCETSYFPASPGTKEFLSVRLLEFFVEKPDPVPVSWPKIDYDLPSGKDGLCDESGWFSAQITDANTLSRIEAGKFRVEVLRRRPSPEAPSIFDQPVEAVHLDLPGTPRSLKGTILFGAKVSAAFKAKVIEICAALGIEPDHLMACMAFETGEHFLSKEQHKNGSVGLICFTEDGASAVGKTKAQLLKMEETEQLEYVKKYFERKAPLIKTLEDVYATIFCPAAVGKSDDYVCYSADKDGDKYTLNSGLDLPGKDGKKDGKITKYEIALKVREKIPRGEDFRG